MSAERPSPPPVGDAGALLPPWRAIDPPELAPPIGYHHAVETRGGRRLLLGGQTAADAEGRIVAPNDLVAQADRAFANLARLLEAGGARPEHLVRGRIYVRDAAAWRTHARAIGQAWRRHLGRWYPAMTLVEVARLYDEQALVEIEGEAVVPDA